MVAILIPEWVQQYVGLPFKEHGRDREGLDCWGLAVLIWREQFHLEVPSYAEIYQDVTDPVEIGPLFENRWLRDEYDWGRWIQVPQDQSRPGDGVLLRIRGRPMHIGVVVASPMFIHIEQDINACLDHLDGSRWNRRILGVWRHDHGQ